MHKKPDTSVFIFDEHIWQVMPFRDGLITPLMNRLFDQTFAMLERYSKVMMVRAEIYISQYSPTNKAFSKFIQVLTRRVKKAYPAELGYAWVREQGSSSKQHYHLALLLNGHKTKHPAKVHGIAQAVCEEFGVFHYSMSPNGFYKLYRGDTESIQAAIYRISYLAKKATKDNRPIQTKSYQASRLVRTRDTANCAV